MVNGILHASCRQQQLFLESNPVRVHQKWHISELLPPPSFAVCVWLEEANANCRNDILCRLVGSLLLLLLCLLLFCQIKYRKSLRSRVCTSMAANFMQYLSMGLHCTMYLHIWCTQICMTEWETTVFFTVTRFFNCNFHAAKCIVSAIELWMLCIPIDFESGTKDGRALAYRLLFIIFVHTHRHTRTHRRKHCRESSIMLRLVL